MRMPPPMKNIVTSEHEEMLWDSRHLSTDSSIGLIQAVIFYLIKCFGLWQGKDLRLLKTEHVTFGEDDIGKFVVIDIKAAVGSGKIVKRYDDPGNPRSVYKILKTYKGYLANEGPFLVRPISSIKDYICYSPWPLGVNIIEQTVLNLMQESGIGPGFGNVSVCLMAINILKSFGAGSHCIATWMLRLYPRYKKIFWAEAFKECSTMNCEDRSQEACLVISHLLDPPYPASTKLVEMRRKQEMMRNKLEAMDARRSSVFNSWLSNINSDAGGKDDPAAMPVVKSRAKSKISQKTTAKLITEKVRTVRKTSCGKSAKSGLSSHNLPSLSSSSSSPSSSDIPQSSNITVKAEIITDLSSEETKSDSSSVKILTVLSIPESAFSSQVDEGESIAHSSDATDGTSLSEQMGKSERTPHYTNTTDDSFSSELAYAGATKCNVKSSKLGAGAQGFKRKLRHPGGCDGKLVPGAKQKRLNDENEVTCSSSGGGNRDSLGGGVQVGARVYVGEVAALCADIKREQESEGEDATDLACDGARVKIEGIENDDQIYGENSCGNGTELPENINSEILSKDSVNSEILNKDSVNSVPAECEINYEKWSCDKQTDSHENTKIHSLSMSLNSLDTAAQREGSQFAHVLKTNMGVKSEQTSSSPQSPSSSSPNVSDQTRDSIEILRKLLHVEGKSVTSEGVVADFENDTSCKKVSLNHSSACKTLQSKERSDDEPGVTNGKMLAMPELQHMSMLIKCSRGGDSCPDSSTCVKSHVASGEPALTTSGKEPEKVSAGRSPDLLNQSALDIVKFLDAANMQLQNILRAPDIAESTGASSGSSIAAANGEPSHLNKNSQHGACPKPVCPSRGGHADDSLKTQKLEERENGGSCVSSNMTISDIIQDSENPPDLAPENSPQKIVSRKDTSYVLLRSVLESPSSPTKSRSSPASSHHKTPSRGLDVQVKSKRRKKFVPARFKTSLTLHTHQELDKAERGFYGTAMSNGKLPQRKRYSSVFKRASNFKTPFKNGRIGQFHKLARFRCLKQHRLLGKSCDHSSHTHLPLPSLLQQVSRDSATSSGIYYYHSNHQENAAYQTLHIQKENQRTQMFMIPEIPLDVPRLGHQEDYVGFPTSEICLGDYFPEGTMLPVKDMKLLTRQGPDGLEVVFKFGYSLQRNSTHAAGQDGPDKTVGISAE